MNAKMLLISIILLIVFFQNACAPTLKQLKEQGARQLSADELRARRDFTHFDYYGEWVVYVDPSGKKIMIKSRTGAGEDVGKREIMGDGRSCHTWNDLKDGVRNCVTVWKLGNEFYSVNTDGRIEQRYRSKRGNPEKL